MQDIKNTEGLINANNPVYGTFDFFIPVEISLQPTGLTEKQQYQVCIICIAQCLTLGIRLEQFRKYLDIPGFSRSHLFKDTDVQDGSFHFLLKCRYGQERPLIGNVLEAQSVRLVMAMLRNCGIEISYFLEVFEDAAQTV